MSLLFIDPTNPNLSFFLPINKVINFLVSTNQNKVGHRLLYIYIYIRIYIYILFFFGQSQLARSEIYNFFFQ